MNIRPLRNNLAVVRVKEKRQTESGIILEGTKSTDVDRAKVVALGPEVKLIKTDDILLVNWNSVKAYMKIDDIPVYLVKEDDIDGVFEA